MKQTSILGRFRLAVFRLLSMDGLMAGRLLFTGVCILLLVMPWTEYFWTFDRFLRGGPDLELGIFALMTLLILVAVLSDHRKRQVSISLQIQRFLSIFFPRDIWSMQSGPNAIREVDRTEPTEALFSYSSPLQI